MKKIIAAIVAVMFMAIGLSACSDDADVVSENISKDADNFKVARRIVFYNGITDTYMLEITGFCNIEDDGQQLEAVCKVGDGAYKKHFLRVSDNATYFVEQLDASNVSADFYKVTFKPSTIVPDVQIR